LIGPLLTESGSRPRDDYRAISHDPVRDVRWIFRHDIHPAVDGALEIGRAGFVIQVEDERKVERHVRDRFVVQYEIRVRPRSGSSSCQTLSSDYPPRI